MKNKIQKFIRAKKLKAISYKLKAPRTDARGIALLFTVLLTSMLLLVALGITNVAYKELLFSSEARDSDKSFYAADTGMECGLFLDKVGVFVAPASVTPMPDGNCNAIPFSVGSSITSTVADIYNFRIPVAINGTCVDVKVEKVVPAILPDTGTYTKISSVGYNLPAGTGVTCTAGSTSLRIVSRALTTQYKNP